MDGAGKMDFAQKILLARQFAAAMGMLTTSTGNALEDEIRKEMAAQKLEELHPLFLADEELRKYAAVFMEADAKRREFETSKEDPYQEIKKLDAMLTEADIPHEFHKHPFMGGYQITYFGNAERPQAKPGQFIGSGVGSVCSVIETTNSYGHEKDLLEISGLMTQEEYERVHDTVLGHLTAEDVFARIKAHWDACQNS